MRAQEDSFLTRDDEPRLARSPEPLTRCNKDGAVYTRAPGTERELTHLLQLPPEAVAVRTAVVLQEDPEYISEESLVYLVRHYLRRNDTSALNNVAERLIQRYTGMVRAHLNTLGAETVEEGHSEITKRLFTLILDLSSDRADFLQVRFWTVCKKQCIKEFARQLKERKRAHRQLPLSAFHGQHSESDNQPEGHTPRFTEDDERRLSVSSHEGAISDRDLREVALEQLDEPFRSAFILRHYYGWPIEDADPTVRTISLHFGKTPRTIQNWLKKAEQTLKEWRGGKNA